MNRESVENIVFKGIGGGGNDTIVGAGFPSFGKEFMKNGGFD